MLQDDSSLLEGVRALDLSLEGTQYDQLQKFVELLRSTNRAMNLVSRRDIGRLETRHVLDSLAAAAWMSRTIVGVTDSNMLDIGSGGGFPGLVLGIVFQNAQMLLVDRSEKKVRFLQRTAMALGLANVEARCHDVSRMKAHTSRFNVVTSRAVAPVELMWPWVSPLLVANGTFVHMSRAAADAKQPISAFAEGMSEFVLLPVPGLETTHGLTTVRKVGQ